MDGLAAVAYRTQHRLRSWLRRFALLWLIVAVALILALQSHADVGIGTTVFYAVLVAAPCALALNALLSVALFAIGR